MPTRCFGSTKADGKPFRVLTLDGGGMRGYYTAKVLEGLADRFSQSRPLAQPDIGRAFDLVVGTSTGGILAAALAAAISMKDVAAVYSERGSDIFKNPIPDETARLGRFAAAHLFSPANDGAELRRALAELFGNRTIGEVYANRGIAFCLQTLELTTHEPVILRSCHLEGWHRDDTISMVDACMATTAAPIVFPPARITIAGEERVMADGNLWANSPIIPAAIEALRISGERPIQIFSIGTCQPPAGTFIPRDAQWGLIRWKFGFGVVEASMDAQASAAILQFDQLREHLRVPVSLVRLHQSAPPEEHQKFIGIDRAHKNAIEAMAEMAQIDADTIYQEAMTPESCAVVLRDIFENLSEIPAKSDYASAQR